MLRLAIIRDNGGDEPRAASDITYRVDIEVDDGHWVYGVPAIPFHARYPDDINTRPSPVGTKCIAFEVGDRYEFLVPELPDYGECEE